jgi:hypothetical protein
MNKDSSMHPIGCKDVIIYVLFYILFDFIRNNHKQ